MSNNIMMNDKLINFPISSRAFLKKDLHKLQLIVKFKDDVTCISFSRLFICNIFTLKVTR